MLLVSHAGPTEPELPLDELLLLVVEPLEPLEPELPELPDDELPLEPLELDVVPVSAAVDESAAPVPLSSSVVGFLVGSVVVLAPASAGAGSALFVSCTALPTSSVGDVAHAVARAMTESAATAMRLERRMAGTLAAELCTLPQAQPNETLR